MGVTPSSRIVSAPTPRRVNVEKDASARWHPLSPNAALALRNSTAVLSIWPSLAREHPVKAVLNREFTKGISLMGVKL